MKTLETLDTPCLVVDLPKLNRNLARMASAAKARGVRLRPHLKTAKSVDIARLAAPDNESPIAVSTLREAEYFFEAGYRDIFYAVGLGPGKIVRAAQLLRGGARLLTLVDSAAAAASLSAMAAKEKVGFRVAIEIDCGEHRGGLSPEDPELLVVARTLGPHFVGVATHAGHSYSARTPRETAVVANDEIQAASSAVARLGREGMKCEVVSIGSTPTAIVNADLREVNEIRAGVYMFGDLFQAAIGSCSVDDIALTVVAEVIGRPSGGYEFLIDAGAFALSKDLSTSALAPEKQAGFGWVCDIDGRLLPGLKVARAWQEQGLVASHNLLPADSFQIGTRVRVLPNHACPTAAAHERYHVVSGSRSVIAEWPRINGW